MNHFHFYRVLHSTTLSVMLFASLSGCVLNAQSPPTQWFILPSDAQSDIRSADLHGPKIAVGPITLPRYLNRSPIVIRHGNTASEIKSDTHACWSEPLNDGCMRILSESLGNELQKQQALVFPYRFALPVDWKIFINITQFDGAPDSDTLLAADWSLLTAKGIVRHSGHFKATIKAEPGINGLVAAQSKLLRLFGRELAQKIQHTVPTR